MIRARLRLPRFNADRVVRNIALVIILSLFGIVGYMFHCVHTSFNRMQNTLETLFPQERVITNGQEESYQEKDAGAGEDDSEDNSGSSSTR